MQLNALYPSGLIGIHKEPSLLPPVFASFQANFQSIGGFRVSPVPLTTIALKTLPLILSGIATIPTKYYPSGMLSGFRTLKSSRAPVPISD